MVTLNYIHKARMVGMEKLSFQGRSTPPKPFLLGLINSLLCLECTMVWRRQLLLNKTRVQEVYDLYICDTGEAIKEVYCILRPWVRGEKGGPKETGTDIWGQFQC